MYLFIKYLFFYLFTYLLTHLFIVSVENSYGAVRENLTGNFRVPSSRARSSWIEKECRSVPSPGRQGRETAGNRRLFGPLATREGYLALGRTSAHQGRSRGIRSHLPRVAAFTGEIFFFSFSLCFFLLLLLSQSLSLLLILLLLLLLLLLFFLWDEMRWLF